MCENLATFLRVKSSGAGGNKTEDNYIQLLHCVMLKEASNLLPNGSASSTSAAFAAETETAGQVESRVECLLANIRDLLQANVRTMARQRREEDENQRMMNDWVVAAAVMDRISFIIIAIIFIGGTAALTAVCIIQQSP